MIFTFFLILFLIFLIVLFSISRYRKYIRSKEQRFRILQENHALVAKRRKLSEDEEIQRYHRQMALAASSKAHSPLAAATKKGDMYLYDRHQQKTSPSYSYPRKKQDNDSGGFFNMFG